MAGASAIRREAKKGDETDNLPIHKRKRPTFLRWGVLYRALAMTYFLTGNPQYHRRGVVSRSCSGWEGVGPTRYGRQEFWEAKVASNWIVYCIVFTAWKRHVH